jgi:hypothetical protein
MGNRTEVRVRGNAHQLLEKYKSLARDASMQGDRVTAEYYMQYADHYYRVLNEFRARQEEQQAQHQQRNRQRDYDDDGDGDMDEIENAGPIRVSEMTRTIPEPQREASSRGEDRNDDDGGSDERDGEGASEAQASDGEAEAPRRRRGRPRRPRREGAEEGAGELAPADA